MVEKKLTLREAVNFAIASVEQEGFVFTKEELAEFEKIANGEMTTEEYRQKLFEYAKKLKKTNPEWFVTPEPPATQGQDSKKKE